MRIALMVIRLIWAVPYYLTRMTWMGKHSSKEKTFAFVKHCVKMCNKKGRVKVIAHGLENLPEKDGFVLFPNHQGLYDVLSFLETCPRPFSFVFKKELKDVILLKQVINCTHSLCIDRDDLRQSLGVIKEMTERVKNGENFLIFAEGTRSKLGNRMQDMKGGSFKSAVKAKAPIVPCALIDCFKPFDEKSTKQLTAQVYYLKPMYYEEYKDMTTVEIAAEVRRRIEEVLFKYDAR